MSLTKVSYSMITGTPVNILDFGADPTGVANSGAAFQNAINAITDDNVLIVPSGTYKITSQLTLGLANTGARLVGIGKPTLLFDGLNNSTDCIVLNAHNYRQIELRNLNIDCNSVGKDGVLLIKGDYPIVDNVTIENSYRDGFVINCSNDYDWVENGEFSILLNSCGRHGIYMNLGGTIGNFINECLWRQVEIRGLSKVTAGGRAIYCTSTASGPGAKISDHNFIKSNLDCAWDGVAPKPSLNIVEVASGAVENWRFLSGGWENTSAANDVTGGYAFALSGGTWIGLTVDSIIWNSLWGNLGVQQTIQHKFIFDFSFNKVQFDGNVGIGVDPTVALEILKATPQIRLKGTGTTSFVVLNAAYGNAALGAIGTAEDHSFMIHTFNTERLRVKNTGSVRFVPITEPGSPQAGDVYYDIGTNKLRCYNGSTWNDLF
jgi:hypothetical protein